jgi:hypothetical protein
MSTETDARQEAILVIIDQLEVTENSEGDLALLKALVRGDSIESYALKLYTEETPAKDASILLSALPKSFDSDKS